MPVMEEISKLSKNGYSDALLDDMCENYDEIECELNGDKHNEPKKHNYDFCVACNKEMLLDNQKSILVCRKCGLCEYCLYIYIFYQLNSQPFRYITTKEYNMILNVFNVMSSIYDGYKPKGKKSFLNYFLS